MSKTDAETPSSEEEEEAAVAVAAAAVGTVQENTVEETMLRETATTPSSLSPPVPPSSPPKVSLQRNSKIADPFQQREGKSLVWQNVNMTLKQKEGVDDRKLLDNVHGHVPRKQITAIMGASGAGKTSLLNILSGRLASHGNIQVSSDVRLNDYVVDPVDINVRKNIAFVAQEDSLLKSSTPREAIMFSAKLRLPRSTTTEELEQLTSRMLTELGLDSCADTYIGGGLMRGISGGEKRRTSVGVELVVKPAMVFLDEPTSGLDSHNAVQLCQVLKKVANAGASVLFTIHQPSSEIFFSFDHLILLNKGRVMYDGSVPGLYPYFEQRNHPIPHGYNPADWMISIAQTKSIKELEGNDFFPKNERSLKEPLTDKAGYNRVMNIQNSFLESENIDQRPVGLGVQLLWLFTREMNNLKRDVGSLAARIGITIILTVMTGVIFLGVGRSDPAIQSNLQSSFGALLIVIINAMMGSAQSELVSFPSTRPIFLREYSTEHYSVVSYFLTRISVELVVAAFQILVLCALSYFMVGFQMNFFLFWATVYLLALSSSALGVFIGCATSDAKTAQEMLPLLLVPQMLFAGFFVTADLIPAWVRWAQWVCSLTHATRILLVAEYDRDCGSEEGNLNCSILLDTAGVSSDEIWWSWAILISIFAGFRLLGLVLLQRRASTFN